MTNADRRLARLCRQLARRGRAGSVPSFCRDTGHGLLEVSHNSLALLGLVLVGVALFVGGRADCAMSSRRRP